MTKGNLWRKNALPEINIKVQYRVLAVFSCTVNTERGKEDAEDHGLINYKDTKTKFRHLEKLTCKGTLRQVFIYWRNSQPCWYFRPSFVNVNV
jgi:hypothetical protein